MPAQVITVTSGKGGVGKTTAVANIAVALASEGAKVVCIDGDIGLRNLDVILGLENRIVYDIVDVIEGRCELRGQSGVSKRVGTDENADRRSGRRRRDGCRRRPAFEDRPIRAAAHR